MTTVTLYGLKTCDTCRKALKELAAAGVEVDFVDIRADADRKTLVPTWIKAAGVKTLLNTRSATWRGLSEAERTKAEDEAGAAELLTAHPTLIKRPVIVEPSGAVHVGWTSEARAALGV